MADPTNGIIKFAADLNQLANKCSRLLSNILKLWRAPAQAQRAIASNPVSLFHLRAWTTYHKIFKRFQGQPRDGAPLK